MRRFFWFVLTATATLAILGTFSRSPLVSNVSRPVLDGWYNGLLLPFLLLGAGIGGALALVARATTRYRPAMQLAVVPRNTALWGAVAMLLSYGVLIGFGAVLMARSSQFPLSTGERVMDLVLTSWKFHAKCASLGAFTTGLTFLLTTALPPAWGGSYALVRPNTAGRN